ARDEHDRFAGRDRVVRGAGELPAVPEVLAVDADEGRLLVRGRRADQLRGLEVGLVAERGEPRDAEPDLAREQRDLDREVPAREDQADRPGSEVARAEIELARPVVDAEAVRSQEDGAGLADARDDGALPRPPLLARLAETGRDGHDCAGAGAERSVSCLLEGRCGYGEDDELG